MKSRIFISLAIITTFTLLYCLSENKSESVKKPVPHMKNVDISKESETKGKLHDEIKIKDIEPNFCIDKTHSKIIKERKSESNNRTKLIRGLQNDIEALIESNQEQTIVKSLESKAIDLQSLIGELTLIEYIALHSKYELQNYLSNTDLRTHSRLTENEIGIYLLLSSKTFSDYFHTKGNYKLPEYFDCLNSKNYVAERNSYIRYLNDIASPSNERKAVSSENLAIYIDSEPALVERFTDILIQNRESPRGRINIEKAIVTLSSHQNSYPYIVKIAQEKSIPSTAILVAFYNKNVELLRQLKSSGFQLNLAPYDLKEIASMVDNNQMSEKEFNDLKSIISLSE